MFFKFIFYNLINYKFNYYSPEIVAFSKKNGKNLLFMFF